MPPASFCPGWAPPPWARGRLESARPSNIPKQAGGLPGGGGLGYASTKTKTKFHQPTGKVSLINTPPMREGGQNQAVVLAVATDILGAAPGAHSGGGSEPQGSGVWGIHEWEVCDV